MCEAEQEHVLCVWTSGVTGRSLGLCHTGRNTAELRSSSLADIYASDGPLEQGTFGTRNLGCHIASGAPCFIKIFRKAVIGRTHYRDFVERDMCGTLLHMSRDAAHPNVVRFLDCFVDQTSLVIVMEPLRGLDLFDRIVDAAPLTELFCRGVMNQALFALFYVHDCGVIHRDVRLENFRYRSLDPGAELVLSDFGLCCYKNLRDDKTVAGSQLYAAPEVASCNYSERCDLWSIGVCLFIMLTGRVPCTAGHSILASWSKDRLRNVLTCHELDHAPGFACSLLRRLLIFDPAERLNAAGALHHEWFHIETTAGAMLAVKRAAYYFARIQSRASASQIPPLACTRHIRWMRSEGNLAIMDLEQYSSGRSSEPEEDYMESDCEDHVSEHCRKMIKLNMGHGKPLPTLPEPTIKKAQIGRKQDNSKDRMVKQSANFRGRLAKTVSPNQHEVPAFEIPNHRASDSAIPKCHMLFSSPLCARRAWKVQLPCGQLHMDSLASTDVEETIATWGLSFESSRPSIIHNVFPDGQVATWNSEQSHIEHMVVPGDEIVEIGFAGRREKLSGRPVMTVLKYLAAWAMRQKNGPTLSESRNQMHEVSGNVDLFCQGLRAMPQLAIQEEIRSLHRTGWCVEPRVATIENIRKLIARGDCRILHLALHCAVEQDQYIILEGKHGQAHVLQSSELKGLLTSGQEIQQIRLVFLNACHSLKLGSQFIHAGVRHVVCVRDDGEVRDESCRLFAEHFFSALRSGKSVQISFNCGVAVLERNQDFRLRSDAREFVLLPEDVHHNDVYVNTRCQVNRRLSAEGLSGQRFDGDQWGVLPPPVEDFLGREIDMHRLYNLIDVRRFVAIVGESGVGKSTLMAEVGRFANLRREAFDEIRWISVAESDIERNMDELRNRLMVASSRRVLLLIDDISALIWTRVSTLLSFHGVHIAVCTSYEALKTILADPLTGLRCATAGLKIVKFHLGPLNPVAQAHLFLRRSCRPLLSSEVHDPPRGITRLLRSESDESPLASAIFEPRRPIDFLALVKSRLMCHLNGNAARIIAAAQRLDYPFENKSRDGSTLLSNTLDASQRLLPELKSTSQNATLRKVRLVRPDGKFKSEWLPCSWRIADVLECFSPRGLAEAADIFINGFRAQPNSLLQDFPNNEFENVLTLEFCARSNSDW